VSGRCQWGGERGVIIEGIDTIKVLPVEHLRKIEFPRATSKVLRMLRELPVCPVTGRHVDVGFDLINDGEAYAAALICRPCRLQHLPVSSVAVWYPRGE
jgi:hypothetical protein